jgi:hypothetical protein
VPSRREKRSDDRALCRHQAASARRRAVSGRTASGAGDAPAHARRAHLRREARSCWLQTGRPRKSTVWTAGSSPASRRADRRPGPAGPGDPGSDSPEEGGRAGCGLARAWPRLSPASLPQRPRTSGGAEPGPRGAGPGRHAGRIRGPRPPPTLLKDPDRIGEAESLHGFRAGAGAPFPGWRGGSCSTDLEPISRSSPLRAAAQLVSERSGPEYNPLFVCLPGRAPREDASGRRRTDVSGDASPRRAWRSRR